jgi:ABC-type phosphate/phosphonate transport system substrate-binding protein
MYNLPEMRPDNAAFWLAMRTELSRRGVSNLTETLDFERKPVPQSIEPGTLFTQVCGWPLQTIYKDQAAVIGIPIYEAAHCDGQTHCGVFLVHRDSPRRSLADLRGCRFVFNSMHSNSGMNLPRRAVADLARGAPFFAKVAETHSQPANIERVANGEADSTCVDCVTFAFFVRHRPELADKVRVLAATPRTPAIPYVTSVATPEPVRAALAAALQAVARAPEWEAARAGLMLTAVAPAAQADYRIPCRYAEEAVALGYPNLE